MKSQDKEQLRTTVRRFYGRSVKSRGGCGCSGSAGNIPDAKTSTPKLDSDARFAYSPEEVKCFLGDQDAGARAGNPLSAASLKPGETVLDLGCGKGLDCLLAARVVGETGHVIGVDMTPEVLSLARRNLARWNVKQVEFRLGEIEHLPVADASVGVVISNCVINLSPDKPRVFKEAFRVMKPGGRLAIEDIIATEPLPEEMRKDDTLYCNCIGGAVTIVELKKMLKKAGFIKIMITPRMESRDLIRQWAPLPGADKYIVSATLKAVKP